jgi:predicted outer membrane repeat protein
VPANDTNALIAAIATANLNGNDPDTICLEGGSYSVTGVYVSLSEGADGFPLISSPMVILGNGATITRASSSYFRFFEITTTGSLTLDNVTLTNGNVGNYGGGAIRSWGTLTFTNGTIRNNRARYAGAIIAGNAGNQLTVANSVISDNTVETGSGAISTQGGTAVITDTTFSNNTVTIQTDTGYAGAIYSNSVLEITRCTFSGNHARTGGALAVFKNTVTISESTFDGNVAQLYGGAIYSEGNTVTITDSVLIDNQAGTDPNGSPSAIHTRRSTTTYVGGNVQMSNSCVAGNSAGLGNSGTNTNVANNWWGAYDGPSGQGTGHGDAISGTTMTYLPFLAAPLPGCPVLPPIPDDKTVDVVYDTPTAITLTAQGGLPPYEFSADAPAHGTLTGAAPDLTYTPDPGYIGTDSFTFSVSGSGEAATGTVSIEVVSDVHAVTESVYTAFNTPVDFTLHATGSQPPFTYELTGTPAHGELSGTAPDYAYTPDAGFSGNDSFGFRVTDSIGFSSAGTITVRVAPELRMPAEFYFYGDPGVPLAVPLNVSGGRTPYEYAFSTPEHGTLEGVPPSLTYTFTTGYEGVDNFTVEVTDANGTTVNGTVHLSTYDPVAASSLTVETAYELPVLITLSGSGGLMPYTFTVTEPPANGTLSGTAPDLTYTPNPGFSGQDTFQYQVTDVHGFSASASVTITVAEQLTLSDAQLATLVDEPLSFILVAQGGVGAYHYTANQPASGTVTGSGPDWLYTPQPGFTGTDVFTIEVRDDLNTAATATITVLVRGPITIGPGDTAALIAVLDEAATNNWPATTRRRSAGKRPPTDISTRFRSTTTSGSIPLIGMSS